MTSMESFIENVKKFPCLWNPDHIAYRDNAKKYCAWNTIAAKSGMVNGREAKTQWKKLRDSHREAIRRRNPASGVPNVIMKPWKYERSMEFLLHQMEQKDFPNGLDSNIQFSHNDASENVQPESPGDTEERLEAEMEDNKEQKREEAHVQRSERRNQTYDMNRVANDALYNLFTSMYLKTRDLPKALQLRVQREVFDAVSRAEEEALAADPVSVSSPASNAYSSGSNFQESYIYENLQVKRESE